MYHTATTIMDQSGCSFRVFSHRCTFHYMMCLRVVNYREVWLPIWYMVPVHVLELQVVSAYICMLVVD